MGAETNFDSRAYRDAARELRSRRHGMLQEFDRYIGGKIERSDDPLTSRFMMDGGAVVSYQEFKALPDFLQDFFADGRAAMPTAVAAFQDYREGKDEGVGYLKAQVHHVELRGSRYWDFDGSKANHGPDEDYALKLLDENMTQDGDILEKLVDFVPKTEAEWLAKLSAFEYLRNDLSAAYYLKKCQQVLEPENCDMAKLREYEQVLEWVSDRYFDSAFMIDGDIECSPILQNIESVRTDAKSLVSFVTDDKFRSRDLIRSHREVGNPLAMLHSIYAVYGESHLRGDGYVRVSERFANADLIVCPLYGGLDGAMSLRYLQKNGSRIVCEITGKPAENMGQNLQILPVLSKIGSRGLIRSSISEGTQLKTLTTDWAVNPESVDPRLVNALKRSERILTVDDSCATGGSEEVLKDWLRNVAGKDFSFDSMVATVNIRWAHKQGLTINDLMARNPIAVTPIVRNMNRTGYDFGSRYIPDATSARTSIRTERTVLSLPEAAETVRKLNDNEIVQAVALDFDDTLISRSLDSRERRSLLNDRAAAFFAKIGVNVSSDRYGEISYKALKKEREMGHKDAAYPNDLLSVYKAMTRAVLCDVLFDGNYTEDDVDFIAENLAKIELDLDCEIIKPIDGADEMLEQFRGMGIKPIIYSNTHYTKEQLMSLLNTVGLGHHFDVENVYVASEVGFSYKPSKQAITRLAQAVGIDAKRMVYIGNSYESDVTAAARANAIAIHFVQESEYKNSYNRQVGYRAFKNEIGSSND